MRHTKLTLKSIYDITNFYLSKMSADENKIQIAVVGDTHVGKTSLIFSYAKDEFPEKYVTTVADEYSISDISY